MNCQRNVNSIQLLHKFSYIVAIFIHNHFDSPNMTTFCWRHNFYYAEFIVLSSQFSCYKSVNCKNPRNVYSQALKIIWEQNCKNVSTAFAMPEPVATAASTVQVIPSVLIIGKLPIVLSST
jgi:hypothetical protein